MLLQVVCKLKSVFRSYYQTGPVQKNEEEDDDYEEHEDDASEEEGGGDYEVTFLGGHGTSEYSCKKIARMRLSFVNEKCVLIKAGAKEARLILCRLMLLV